MLDLEDFLPYLIRRLTPLIDDAFSHNLQAVDLTLEMWRVIINLYDRGPLSLSSISTLTSINLSTLSRIADRMQKRKLIRRVMRSEGSRRWSEIELLPLGVRKCELLIPEAVDIQKQLIRTFSETELADMKSMLRKLYLACVEVAANRAPDRHAVAPEQSVQTRSATRA